MSLLRGGSGYDSDKFHQFCVIYEGIYAFFEKGT